MSKIQLALTAETARVLSPLRDCTRTQPERFQRGAALLLKEFSIEAVRRRLMEELEAAQSEFESRYPSDNRIAWEEGTFESRSRVALADVIVRKKCRLAQVTVWTGLIEALDWVRGFPHARDSFAEAEAEMIGLLAVLGYDEDASTNPALPKVIREALTGHSFSDFVDGAFRIFCKNHLGQVRSAWAIIESRGRAPEARTDPVFIESFQSHSADSVPPTIAVSTESTRQVPRVDTQAFLRDREIAQLYDVKPDALRKRLSRWRRGNDGWREVSDRKPRESRYLYRVVDVLPLIEKMRASSEASGERPANDTPQP